MTSDEFIRAAKKAVRNSYNAQPGVRVAIGSGNVFLVWFCKTLQNYKALLITDSFDGKYYEFTYNGDKDEAYLDVYGKHENIVCRRVEDE